MEMKKDTSIFMIKCLYYLVVREITLRVRQEKLSMRPTQWDYKADCLEELSKFIEHYDVIKNDPPNHI